MGLFKHTTKPKYTLYTVSGYSVQGDRLKTALLDLQNAFGYQSFTEVTALRVKGMTKPLFEELKDQSGVLISGETDIPDKAPLSPKQLDLQQVVSYQYKDKRMTPSDNLYCSYCNSRIGLAQGLKTQYYCYKCHKTLSKEEVYVIFGNGVRGLLK
jgi:hypothetical protein